MQITQGDLSFQVDDEDVAWVKGYEWEMDEKGFIVRFDIINGHFSKLLLHREVWTRHKTLVRRLPLFHKNGDKMDNRMDNLTPVISRL